MVLRQSQQLPALILRPSNTRHDDLRLLRALYAGCVEWELDGWLCEPVCPSGTVFTGFDSWFTVCDYVAPGKVLFLLLFRAFWRSFGRRKAANIGLELGNYFWVVWDQRLPCSGTNCHRASVDMSFRDADSDCWLNLASKFVFWLIHDLSCSCEMMYLSSIAPCRYAFPCMHCT